MSKIAVKSPTTLPPKTGSIHALPWNNGTTSRLSKARSSPNVSRSTNLSAAKQTIKIEDNVSTVMITQRRTVGVNSQKTPITSPRSQLNNSATISSKSGRSSNNNNITVVQISGEPDNHHHQKSARSSSGRSRMSDANKQTRSSSSSNHRSEVVKKRHSKESSPSCTILEDRVLLKKGLNSPTPADNNKLPRKPDELRKKSLNRSTSLWSVQTPNELTKHNRSTKSNHTDSKLQKSRSSSKPSLNRATSLWSVPADPQCRLSKLPSRIPLSTQHLANLGQSLGDLTAVDRSVEKPNLSVKEIVGFDEVDRSVDEHIYENCREVKLEGEGEDSPIYENLNDTRMLKASKDEKSKKTDLSLSLSVPLTTSELEKRAEQLLSQLDEDDNVAVVCVKSQNNKEIDLVNRKIDRSKDILLKNKDNLAKNRGELARSRGDLSNNQENLEKSRVFAKSQDSLQILQCNKRPECEMSIKEIRKNWERQIEKSQVVDDDAKLNKKRLTKSSTNINCSRNTLTLPLVTDNNSCNKTKNTSTLQVASKRTKEIEHLVNFFNCKNTESSAQKASSIIQDSWVKSPKDSIDVVSVKSPSSEKSEKIEKSCGYASDGNSSEDSGHISNENEPDWKEDHQQDQLEEIKDFKNHRKNEIFLEEIIQDLDTSLERTIEVFEATPIVRRFVPVEQAKAIEVVSSPSKNCISSSSGASSIDSWDETLKTSRKNTVKSVATPTPTQRHNVPSQVSLLTARA